MERITAALRADGVELASGEDWVHARIAIVFVGRDDAASLHRVRQIAARCERLLAVMVSDHPLDARLLLGAGADDVVTDVGVRARVARWLTIEGLVDGALVRANVAGRSRSWRSLLRRIVEIARFTSASMLIAGESGTGKELVARLVHSLDAREDKGNLVVLDCAAIVPSLSGSEFFGHERGAYTGAVGARDGAFALAHGGTLFLDEIGDLPLPLQAQLLRVIQERTYKRVGGNDWLRTDFRLVCATHRDLAAAARSGEFRHDLYHRIATWTFRLPSLAERRDDIPALARHFLDQVAHPDGPLELDATVERYLVERAYPGNIRELRHTVQRLVDRCPDRRITIGQIPDDERATAIQACAAWPDPAFEDAVRRAIACSIGLRDVRRTAEELAVQMALALEDGSVSRTARRLGITERALQLRLAARRGQLEEPDAA